MISAMAEGARILGEVRYLQAAERAADFLLGVLSRPDGGLYRTYRSGTARLNACLEDYAYLAEGLIDLYEAGGKERYAGEAVRLSERTLADFAGDENGGFFTTAKDHDALILRSREGPDGAIPSGNAVAASALARLSFHYGLDDFRQAAANAVRVYGHQIVRYPRAFAKSLAVADLLLTGPTELALVGVPGEPGYEALRAVINQIYLPNRIIALRNSDGPDTRHPLLAGKELVNGKAALYICRNFACQAPITDPAAATSALAASSVSLAAHPSAGGTPGRKTLAGTRLPGHASPDGTRAYTARIGSNSRAPKNGLAYGSLGSVGLTVSRLGFGGYRIDTDEPDHREALVKALREGCNLIDTSTNYADGDSERLIGVVLAELIRKGELAREEIVVVSKIGYVQGQNLRHAEVREKAGKPYPEMVKYGTGIWHCIHPDYLADQLDLSLDRVGLQTLDVCLLHNPEYFLSEAKHHGAGDLTQLRTEFYGRLRAAFTYFETQVAAGRIQCYGVSSNTCTAQPSDPEAISLRLMLDAAQAAALDAGGLRHHFTVLQCPMNLFESGALFTANTGPDHSQTVLDLAQAEGLAVLINRPLNAMLANGNGMVRLAEPPLEPVTVSFDTQRDRIAGLEQEYSRELAPHIQHHGQGPPPEDYFRWAEELTKVRPLVQNLEQWEQIENQMVAPHVNQVLRALTQHLTGETGDRWRNWRDRYVPELLALLRALRREATVKSREKTAAIVRLFDPLLPESKRRETLSRKALWVLVSTPGVTCVLNGMRSPSYVDDSLAVLHWEPLPDVRRIYETIRSGWPREVP